MNIWFSDQFYNEQHYNNLLASVSSYPKAITCFHTHWIKDESAIPTQRSNMCAERAIKVVQELNATNAETLNKWFLLFNILLFYDFSDRCDCVYSGKAS